jgi:hypothetical protein
VGWCAPQQGACKLTLNVKGGVSEEAAHVEMMGLIGMGNNPMVGASSQSQSP